MLRWNWKKAIGTLGLVSALPKTTWCGATVKFENGLSKTGHPSGKVTKLSLLSLQIRLKDKGEDKEVWNPCVPNKAALG
jgi:hypothetical protein